MVYKKTGKMPTALRTRPKIPPHLLEYWNGFVALDRSRTWVYGSPLGIQYSEILAYSRIVRFSAEDMEDFSRIISVLDAHYMDWRAEHGKN